MHIAITVSFFAVVIFIKLKMPMWKEMCIRDRRIGDDRNPDFEELENVLLQSDLAEKIVNEFHTPVSYTHLGTRSQSQTQEQDTCHKYLFVFLHISLYFKISS